MRRIVFEKDGSGWSAVGGRRRFVVVPGPHFRDILSEASARYDEVYLRVPLPSGEVVSIDVKSGWCWNQLVLFPSS